MSNLIDVLKRTIPGTHAIFSGRLERQSRIFEKATEALSEFIRFGGEGWLCIAENPEILRFTPGNPLLGSVVENSFPISGEAAVESKSIHLSRGDSGWVLTEISRLASQEDDDLIVRTNFRNRTDRNEVLTYETYWKAINVDENDGDEQEELRPCCFRYVGFTPVEKED